MREVDQKQQLILDEGAFWRERDVPWPASSKLIMRYHIECDKAENIPTPLMERVDSQMQKQQKKYLRWEMKVRPRGRYLHLHQDRGLIAVMVTDDPILTLSLSLGAPLSKIPKAIKGNHAVEAKRSVSLQSLPIRGFAIDITKTLS